MTKPYLFILLIILTPFFWSNLFWPKKIIQEYSKTPQYLKERTGQLLSDSRIKPIEDMRWYSINRTLGRVFFNKTYLLPDEFFLGLKAISPPTIFAQSDSKNTVSFLLLPFVFQGVHLLIKARKHRPLFLFFSTALVPIILGTSTPYFLPITVLFYLYFSYLCLVALPSKQLIILFSLLLIHNIIIFGQNFWL